MLVPSRLFYGSLFRLPVSGLCDLTFHGAGILGDTFLLSLTVSCKCIVVAIVRQLFVGQSLSVFLHNGGLLFTAIVIHIHTISLGLQELF